MILSKESHYHNKHQQDAVTKHTSLKRKSKSPNAAMTIDGVEHTPLFLGQVQIGTIHSSQREMLIDWLMIREVDMDPKDLITKLKKKLEEDENENVTDPTIKKCFFQLFLTATC